MINESHALAYIVIMIPKDVGRRLGTVFYDAGQVDHASLIDVQIRSAKNGGSRHWNNKNQLEHSLSSKTMTIFYDELLITYKKQ